LPENSAKKNIQHVINACVHWPDDRYDPALLDAVIELGSGTDLAYVGSLPSEKRWSPKIAEALIRKGDATTALRLAEEIWPEERKAILRKLLTDT